MRVPLGAIRMQASSMPGTPTASKMTTGRVPSTRRHAAMAGSTVGSTTSSAPSRSASARRPGERSAATTGLTPRCFRSAITARPIGPQPRTIAASSLRMPLLATACTPTANGSVSAASRGSRPFGTFRASRSLSTIRSA